MCNSILCKYIICGESATTFHEGIQRPKQLNALLDEPRIIGNLGKNFQLDLKGLLIDPLYANLRNEVMHDKFPTIYFNTINVIYCWWLILKILISPILKDLETDEEELTDVSN